MSTQLDPRVDVLPGSIQRRTKLNEVEEIEIICRSQYHSSACKNQRSQWTVKTTEIRFTLRCTFGSSVEVSEDTAKVGRCRWMLAFGIQQTVKLIAEPGPDNPVIDDVCTDINPLIYDGKETWSQVDKFACCDQYRLPKNIPTGQVYCFYKEGHIQNIFLTSY